MNQNVMLVILFVIIFAMIAVVLWYLKAGYSYQQTIDELPADQGGESSGTDDR